MLTRRQFSKLIFGSGVLVSSNLGRAVASPAQSASPDCDLLIKGGTVVDPSQNLHEPLDVAVKGAKILEVSPNIPAARARSVVSAKGKIVTPGVIDVHVHVFEGMGPIPVNADLYCLNRGVTTALDTGSTGYAGIAGLTKYVIRPSATRIYALLDINGFGIMMGLAGEYANPEWVNSQATAWAAEENRPDVVGIKCRLSRETTGPNDLEVLKRALEAAKISRLPLMVHIGDSYSPLSEILGQMRKGDVLTHCFNGRPNGILDTNGKVRSEVQDARARGVFFDVAHGSNSFDFDVAEKCMQQNFTPDTISSDLAATSVNGPTFDLVTTASKFLLLGLSLDQVIERITVRPTRIFDFAAQLGTLRPGTGADISILEVREGSFLFTDTDGKKRMGRQKLQSAATIRAGRLYVNRSEDLTNA
ncbi:MAG: amidohydrolase/deacetylase family metallohydrolase [Acidobacteria bacterium]|nr:MAG: amidohydrolase/deacetylase family metallohydrolase [Acidobacteriota bacterium]